MTTFPIAVSLFMNLLLVLWLFIGVALILVILVQKGKGGGLSAAFGGMGASSLFGAKTGDFLTWVTIAMAGAFLLLAIVLGIFYRPAPSAELEAPARQTQQALPQEIPAPAQEQETGTIEQTLPQDAPQLPEETPQVPSMPQEGELAD